MCAWFWILSVAPSGGQFYCQTLLRMRSCWVTSKALAYCCAGSWSEYQRLNLEEWQETSCLVWFGHAIERIGTQKQLLALHGSYKDSRVLSYPQCLSPWTFFPIWLKTTWFSVSGPSLGTESRWCVSDLPFGGSIHPHRLAFLLLSDRIGWKLSSLS